MSTFTSKQREALDYLEATHPEPRAMGNFASGTLSTLRKLGYIERLVRTVRVYAETSHRMTVYRLTPVGRAHTAGGRTMAQAIAARELFEVRVDGCEGEFCFPAARTPDETCAWVVLRAPQLAGRACAVLRVLGGEIGARHVELVEGRRLPESVEGGPGVAKAREV